MRGETPIPLKPVLFKRGYSSRPILAFPGSFLQLDLAPYRFVRCFIIWIEISRSVVSLNNCHCAADFEEAFKAN